MCFSDSRYQRGETAGLCRKSALRHSGGGERRERRQEGGEQGHSKGREGCVFTDLVRAMESPPPPPHPPPPPPCQSSSTYRPASLYWRVKGTFEQHQTNSNECREAGRRDGRLERDRRGEGREGRGGEGVHANRQADMSQGKMRARPRLQHTSISATTHHIQLDLENISVKTESA